MPRVGSSQGSQLDADEVSNPADVSACPVDGCVWRQNGNQFRVLANHFLGEHPDLSVGDLNRLVFGSENPGYNRYFKCDGCGAMIYSMSNFSRHATQRFRDHPDCKVSFHSQEQEEMKAAESGSTDEAGGENNEQEIVLPLELITEFQPETGSNIGSLDEVDGSDVASSANNGSHEDGSMQSEGYLVFLSDEERESMLELIAFYGRFPLFVVNHNW